MTTFRWTLTPMLIFATACGVNTADVDGLDDTLDEAEQELSTTKDTFLIVRRDYRRCIAPKCGGYWVTDLNSTMQERYVNALDFSESTIPAAAQDVIVASPDHELVLWGRLGPKESRFNTRSLVTKRAFRGMPGKTFLPTDKFYSVFPTKIACINQPCANLQTTRVNRTTGHTMASDLDYSAALAPLVDPQWLVSRSYVGQTVVAGNIVRKNRHVTVVARQVFVELPDRVTPCASETPPVCDEGQVPSWERTGQRCLQVSGCTAPRYCALYVPSCDQGYRQVSWQNGCTQYACEPEFLEE
jgi:hypothetical protein